MKTKRRHFLPIRKKKIVREQNQIIFELNSRLYLRRAQKSRHRIHPVTVPVV